MKRELSTDLRWYLGPGQAVFEGSSSMGPALDRAEKYFVPPSYTPQKRPKSQPAGTCIGCKEPIAGEWCENCGYSEALRERRFSAQHNAEKATFNWEPADDPLYTRYSETGRQLDAVRRRDAYLAAVLEAAYGSAGSRYTVAGNSPEELRKRASVYAPWFELFAVVPLIPVAQQLEELARKSGQTEGPTHERIYRWIAMEGSKQRHKELVSEVMGEARKVHLSAARLWDEVGRKFSGR